MEDILMDFIRFSVRGQRLDYDKRYYSSTETIDTLYCNFKFETDDLGHIWGGWNLPYLWTQFHDKEGNVYVKEVTADNTCSIPYNCLRQCKFKMTLFATDTENYIECTKRYTTNEVLFIFNGSANLNYDGGVSPDEPMPTQWQILLDRVDTCESNVDGLSQNVTSMQSTVDELSTELDAESAARESTDMRLEGLIGDRYTKSETDALLDAKQDSLNDSQLAAVNSGLTSSDKTTLDDLSQSVPLIENAISDLDSRVTTNTNAIGGINITVDNLSQDMSSLGSRVDELSTEIANESTARENADADLRLLINDETNERIAGYNALDTRVTANEDAIEDTNATVELLYKTLKKDNSWTELSELVRSGKAEQFLNYGDRIEEN